MKIINKLKSLWQGYSDKIIHFLFGYFIASAFQVTGYYMMAPVVIAATWKELYDLKRDNIPVKFTTLINADWMCTVAGGFIALFIYAVSLLGGVHLPGFIDVIIK